MSPEERLHYEARVRTRQAVIAVLAGVFLLLASIVSLAGPHATVSELTLDLITANKRSVLDVIAAVINALGSLTLAATLVYLHGAARARNAKVQPWLRILAIVGGVAAAIAGIGYAVLIAVKAHQFATTGSQTYQEAHNLTSGSGLVGLQLVGQASALLLAFAFVLISLGAMRAGLLTRFMGYLGVFAGILILFQIIQVPIVQTYWLLALGYLISGRWPSGVPPAWQTGKAEPWPSSQSLREQRAQAAAARGGGGRPGRGRAKPAPTPAPETVGAPAPPATRAGTPKRKRKRRK
ncbi:MAG: hypothetical protein JO039_12355 [Solirubrobacterales bacterium]|nr:hypothetical protein [Solirubrobacterales bacterium]